MTIKLIIFFGVDEWLEDFNICFPGMGDLRNVIMTVVSIPAQAKGTIKFYLNDIEPFIMARNVTILLLLLKYGLDGIDAALQVWYSISMTKQQYDMILKMFDDNLSQGINLIAFSDHKENKH